MSTPIATQLITRAKLSADYRISVAYGGPLAGAYAHARHAPPQGLLLDKQADIQAEIDHVCGMYHDAPRLEVDVPVKWGNYTPGEVKTFRHHRYGFAAGKPMVIKRIQKDRINKTMILTLWG